MKEKETQERSGVKDLVRALCRDFSRREEELKKRNVGLRCAMEYRYLNAAISEAAVEAVGERLAPDFIREIGDEVGYAKSAIDCLSEGTYKSYKSLVLHNIAKKLHLED